MIFFSRGSLADYAANMSSSLPPEDLVRQLESASGMQVYPHSIASADRRLFFLGRKGAEKFLGVLGPSSVSPEIEGKAETLWASGNLLTRVTGPRSSANAAALRKALPFLTPQTLGLKKSAGCGDRLGLATPGHVRAIRKSAMAPIFAQQSIRENARTGRTPQQVMDDALWGVLQEGWRDGFGADADHLKTTDDIDVCAAAGFTFYTFDPGEHVNNRAGTATPAEIQVMSETLPWDALETNPADLICSLADRPIGLDGFKFTMSREELMRAAAKYGRAVAHTAKMYRHLAQTMGSLPFELEMSVDETETVTSLAEHVYIAHELRRLGVRWVSLAPRYVGTFEKGVDYIGSLAEFRESFARHLAVARTFGPYKLSLHSGSDKFSVYPIAASLAGELIHLKTAGTSYLEALRAIATLDPALFRGIVAFAIEKYPVDRASYHVSADASRVPEIASWPDSRLPEILDDFHAREILHVNFGSVLQNERFRERFFSALNENEETYYQMLERHFDRHLSPFS
ncbi:MAG TPA: tagaturonate epimerase family protein [Acidobacteriota bacterium]|nr:tagaturonate epimerase family protein [Acidobacteriota bacterium]